MDKRSAIGLGVMVIGFVLMGIGALFGFMGLLAVSIYSLVFIVVGLIIMLNKSEDKIEEINYSKMKGGLKKK